MSTKYSLMSPTTCTSSPVKVVSGSTRQNEVKDCMSDYYNYSSKTEPTNPKTPLLLLLFEVKGAVVDIVGEVGRTTNNLYNNLYCYTERRPVKTLYSE